MIPAWGWEGLSHRGGGDTGQVSLARLALAWDDALELEEASTAVETHQAGLASRGNNTLKASPVFLGWIFVFRVPTLLPLKCCFAFMKGRTAPVLLRDRAVYQVSLGGPCRAKPLGPDCYSQGGPLLHKYPCR